MSNIIKLGDEAAFQDWLKSMEVLTDTVYLCLDTKLVEKRELIASDIEFAKEQGKSFTKDDTLTDTDVVAELEAQLEELDAAIREKSTGLEVKILSEEFMLSIQKLHDEENMNEWILRITAEALGKTRNEGIELRSHLPRLTYNYLSMQIVSKCVNVNYSTSLTAE